VIGGVGVGEDEFYILAGGDGELSVGEEHAFGDAGDGDGFEIGLAVELSL
jgi:hypothetical protein